MEDVLSQDAIPSKLRNQVDRPLPMVYCPEVDVSPLLDATMTTRFQNGFGALSGLWSLEGLTLKQRFLCYQLTMHAKGRTFGRDLSYFLLPQWAWEFQVGFWSCLSYDWRMMIQRCGLERFLSQCCGQVAARNARTSWIASQDFPLCRCRSCWKPADKEVTIWSAYLSEQGTHCVVLKEKKYGRELNFWKWICGHAYCNWPYCLFALQTKDVWGAINRTC